MPFIQPTVRNDMTENISLNIQSLKILNDIRLTLCLLYVILSAVTREESRIYSFRDDG